jgi:hypothetical protein
MGCCSSWRRQSLPRTWGREVTPSDAFLFLSPSVLGLPVGAPCPAQNPRMTRGSISPAASRATAGDPDARVRPASVRLSSRQPLARSLFQSGGPCDPGSPPRRPPGVPGTDSHGRMDHPKILSPREVNARLRSRDRTGLPNPAIDLELRSSFRRWTGQHWVKPGHDNEYRSQRSRRGWWDS